MPRYKLENGERIQLTAEEEAQRDADETSMSISAFDREISDLRLKRNKLLTDSDWEVTMAKEKGTTLSSAFKNWRQELRDITDGLTTVEEIQAVIFPTKPN